MEDKVETVLDRKIRVVLVVQLDTSVTVATINILCPVTNLQFGIIQEAVGAVEHISCGICPRICGNAHVEIGAVVWRRKLARLGAIIGLSCVEQKCIFSKCPKFVTFRTKKLHTWSMV